MITLGIQSDIEQVVSKFEKLAADQVPFAISLALNRTAQLTIPALQNTMKVVFDRPTPYVLNSLAFAPAKKTNLEVIIGHRAPPGKISAGASLAAEILGGDRKLKSTEKIVGFDIVPTRYAKLDQYGNLPSQTMRLVREALEAGASASKTREFVYIPQGNPRNLPAGVYQRTKRGLMPIVFLEPHVRYRERYDLAGVVGRVFQAEFGRQFQASLEYAISTAKTSES